MESELSPQALLLLYDIKLAIVNVSCEQTRRILKSDARRRAAATDCLAQVVEFSREFDQLLRCHPRSQTVLGHLETLEPQLCCSGHPGGVSYAPLPSRQDSPLDGTILRLKESLYNYLKGRTLGIFQGHQNFCEVMQLVQEKTQEWIDRQDTQSHRNGSRLSTATNGSGSRLWPPPAPPNSFYVLDCVSMHCVPGETLQEWIVQTHNMLGIQVSESFDLTMLLICGLVPCQLRCAC